MGLSPRGRGNPPSAHPGGTRSRSIPAWAFEQSTYTVQEGNSTTVKVKLNQSQGEMHIRRIPSNRGRTDFNMRAVELYLAAATRTHHLRNVDPTLALV